MTSSADRPEPLRFIPNIRISWPMPCDCGCECTIVHCPHCSTGIAFSLPCIEMPQVIACPGCGEHLALGEEGFSARLDGPVAQLIEPPGKVLQDHVAALEHALSLPPVRPAASTPDLAVEASTAPLQVRAVEARRLGELWF